MDGNEIVVYKPVVPVTQENRSALQFLDLMSVIDKYSELKGDDLKKKLRQYIEAASVDFGIVKQLLPLYPDRVYRNLYDGGLMNELV